MTRHVVTIEVVGSWSLRASRRFWEGFRPTTISPGGDPDVLHAHFVSEHDWTPAAAHVAQHGTAARIEVSGGGDLNAAAEQAARFLSLDIDATDWPGVGDRDPIIAAAQRALPGFRPCGFHSPMRRPRGRCCRGAPACRRQRDFGIGPFAADLALIRSANTVDVLPLAERRLDAEINHLYGPDTTLADVSEIWRPFRSWAAVYLRALRGERMREMS